MKEQYQVLELSNLESSSNTDSLNTNWKHYLFVLHNEIITLASQVAPLSASQLPKNTVSKEMSVGEGMDKPLGNK